MLSSLTGRSILWRGIHYHIGTAGRITLLGRALDRQQRREILAVNDQRLNREKAACAATRSHESAAASQTSASHDALRATEFASPRRVA
jgi:hypothetical protein